MGKSVADESDFQSAVKLLDQELIPEEELLNPDGKYLKTVAQGLLYKVSHFLKIIHIVQSFYIFSFISCSVCIDCTRR